MKIMTVWNESNDQRNVWKKMHDHHVQQPKGLDFTIYLFALVEMPYLLEKVPHLENNVNVSGFHYAHFSTWDLFFLFL